MNKDVYSSGEQLQRKLIELLSLAFILKHKFSENNTVVAAIEGNTLEKKHPDYISSRVDKKFHLIPDYTSKFQMI